MGWDVLIRYHKNHNSALRNLFLSDTVGDQC